mgnify:CR=1 FL=1
MKHEDWSLVDGEQTSLGRVCVLDQVASTQNEVRRRLLQEEVAVVIAKRQVEGRGRQGRTWDDAGGGSLCLSFAVRTALTPAGLSIAVGLGVLYGCIGLGAVGLGLKWPNDIVESHDDGPGRKLAGVLIESVGTTAIVGVGINVCGSETIAEALSLQEIGVTAGRPEVVFPVLDGMATWLSATPDSIRQAWQVHGLLRGKPCRFRVDGNQVVGVVVDLDPQWRLVLETDEGRKIRVDAAHAHFEEVLALRG